jgi:hypothetical protein
MRDERDVLIEEMAEVIESLRSAILFDSRDWTEPGRCSPGMKKLAWIYGIVVGMDEEAYEETRFSRQGIERNKRLHNVVRKVRGYAEKHEYKEAGENV